MIKKQPRKIPRSTVGTVTEIYDYFRVLFARIGIPYSPATGKEIKSMSVRKKSWMNFLKWMKVQTICLLSPMVKNRKGEFKKELENLNKKGLCKIQN